MSSRQPADMSNGQEAMHFCFALERDVISRMSHPTLQDHGHWTFKFQRHRTKSEARSVSLGCRIGFATRTSFLLGLFLRRRDERKSKNIHQQVGFCRG